MKAVILAGGEGTRLRPLTCNTPKVMVPILNRPFLEQFIAYLKKHGVDEVILALGYLPEPVRSYFGNGEAQGVRLSYSVEDRPLGTAGAVKYARLDGRDPFLVFNGDVVTDIDLTEMVRLHRQRAAVTTIALTPVDNPSSYGVVETDVAQRVGRFVEKPAPGTEKTNMINAGVYVLQPEVLDVIRVGARCMFEQDIFPLLLAMGKPVYGYLSDAYWIDIGTPDKYLKTHHDLLRQGVFLRDGGSETDGVVFEGDAAVSAEADVKGPALVGPGCRIGKGAVVRPGSVLGRGCVIEEGAVVEGAVLWDDVRIGAGAVVRNCIVANGSTVEDGARVLDMCVIGDRAVIGRDNVLDRGMKLWPVRTLPAGAISF